MELGAVVPNRLEVSPDLALQMELVVLTMFNVAVCLRLYSGSHWIPAGSARRLRAASVRIASDHVCLYIQGEIHTSYV
jgi:hypothetical protein